MEYGYGFDDDSPRFALGSLWFLVGVIIFAFSVLIMTAIVTAGPERGYYLNTKVQQQPSQRIKPVVTKNNVPSTGTSSRYNQ